MRSLTWQQVNAWRLSQHCLSPRLPRQDFIQAVSRTGGLQAQVLSAAELALWARVDGLAPDDLQAALWRDRTLIKTWAMRGTLHLIAASELPLYVAARSLYDIRNWDSYFAYYGLTPGQQQALLDGAAHVLGGQPMTREQLAAALADHIGVPAVRDLIVSSNWGSPLKPLAFRGDLCFGPSQGQNVTFVRPSAWTGTGQPAEPQEALQEIARRYLRAYGPATPQDFARWWAGGGLIAAKKLFKSLEDELEAVDVAGWRALALRTTVEPMQSLDAANTVRLLALFDPYVLGIGRDIEPLLAKAYKLKVYRPQGWISAVVLVDGFIKGVWEYTTRRSQTFVTIQMFAPPTMPVRKGIEAETERLGAFLNTEVVLEYADQ